MEEIRIPDDAAVIGKRIVELGTPATINILSIERAGVYIVPNGSTKLMGGDILHVLAEDESALELLSATLGLS